VLSREAAVKVTVHLPGPLVPLTDGAANVTLEVPGGTVGDVLTVLFAQHSRLRDRIVDELGHVRPHVNLFVDRESIRHLGGLEAPIHDGATLSVIAAVSGGSSPSLHRSVRVTRPALPPAPRPRETAGSARR
jgi:molybdopterin synthase sulfur carrier subunit